MTPQELIILNLKEIRRRSIKVWLAIPTDRYDWRPDPDAMSCLEMMRHMVESPYIYQHIIKHGGKKQLGFVSPWETKPFSTMQNEIEFCKAYEKDFYDMVNSFSEKDLDEIEIIRPELNQRRKLGDYLLRIAYHEGVHTGQLLSYLRTMGVERPEIWD